jgi:hypothetical protein
VHVTLAALWAGVYCALRWQNSYIEQYTSMPIWMMAIVGVSTGMSWVMRPKVVACRGTSKALLIYVPPILLVGPVVAVGVSLVGELIVHGPSGESSVSMVWFPVAAVMYAWTVVFAWWYMFVPAAAVTVLVMRWSGQRVQ